MHPLKKHPPHDVESLYDEYANRYNEEFIPPTFSTARTALSFANEITWHFILKYLPADFSIAILDAGGGDGFWAQKIYEVGYRNITITDNSQEMLNLAQKRFQTVSNTEDETCKFIKADIANMSELSDDSFDFVMSLFDPVSYCMHPKEAINELSRVAKPSSYIVISLDTKFRRIPELIEANQIEKAIELLDTNISYDFRHPQYNFTWEELAKLLEGANCDVCEVVGAPVFMHQVSEIMRNHLESDPVLREKLLKIELQNCTNRSLVNFAGYLLMVGQKR